MASKEINKRKFDTNPNVRFWAWINGGWVKLTLPPEMGISHVERERYQDEYGGETRETVWFNNAAERVIERSYYRTAVDCDGRLDYSSEAYAAYTAMGIAHTSDMDTGDPADAGIIVPDWTYEIIGQRDHAAEAMGY